MTVELVTTSEITLEALDKTSVADSGTAGVPETADEATEDSVEESFAEATDAWDEAFESCDDAALRTCDTEGVCGFPLSSFTCSQIFCT